MRLRNMIMAVVVMLFLFGISSKTNAQEWEGWRHRYYRDHHPRDVKWSDDHYYYRPWGGGIFNWGWGWGWRGYYYDNYHSDHTAYRDYVEKHHNDYYRDYREHRDHNYRYFDDDNDRNNYRYHYRDYWHRFHDDNYRPEVDNNK